MKPSPRAPRTPRILSDSIHHQLNLYTLAATAAGIGMLALARPAEAKVIYTKTHLVIAGAERYNLDLNHDKITDFTLVNFWSSSCGDSCGQVVLLKPPAGNSAIGYVLKRSFTWHVASAMKMGSAIGPRGHFQAGTCELVIGRSSNGASGYGPWFNVTNRYLGLKFKIKGKTHYGWARLTVTGTFGSIVATLTGYAYETIPNKAIIAGHTKSPDMITDEPDTTTGTLGRLALGRK
jgi:hypothetical protein